MTAPALARDVPRVLLGGRSVADVDRNLVELRVTHEYRLPGSALLRFQDSEYRLSDKSLFTIGSTLDVELPVRDLNDDRAQSYKRVFRGSVTALSLDFDARRPHVLVVHAQEKGEVLARGDVLETWLDMSPSDCVRKIAARRGLRADVDTFSIRSSYQVRLMTDLQVLNTLADEVGADWWLEEDTLCFKKVDRAASGSPVVAVPGRNLSRLEVTADAQAPDETEVAFWQPDRKGATVSGKRGAVPVNGGSALLKPAAKPGAALGTASTARVGTESVRTRAQAEGRAASVAARADAAAVTAYGEVSANPLVVVGGTVRVDDAGPATGSYHVTKVEHVYRGTAETRFVAGERRPRALADTLGQPTSSKVPGLLVGTVTAHGTGSEQVEDGVKTTGRVRVALPGLGKQANGQDVVSAWARVLSLGADPKSKRGLVSLPEIGDEVLVGFEHGDPRQPVVLGSLFGQEAGKSGFFPVGSGSVLHRRLTSRLGHELELGDGTGPADQHVALRIGGDKGHQLRLGKDECALTLPAGVPLKIKVGTATLTIQNDQLTIDAQKISMSSKTDVEIKAQTGLKLSGLTVDIAAQTTATVKANAQLTLQASGPAALKGAVVQIN